MAKFDTIELKPLLRKEFNKLKVKFRIPKTKLYLVNKKCVNNSNTTAWYDEESNNIRIFLRAKHLKRKSDYLKKDAMQSCFLCVLLHEICHAIQYKQKRLQKYFTSFENLWSLEYEAFKFSKKHHRKLYGSIKFKDYTLEEYKSEYKRIWLDLIKRIKKKYGVG